MHAGTVIYEVHTCAQGQWQAAATFTDPNAAVAEAVRLRNSQRYDGIRVIEAFHDAVDKSAARAIYRYTAATERSLAIADGAHLNQAKQTTDSKAWNVGRFMPRLSVVIAALLVLMTFSAA